MVTVVLADGHVGGGVGLLATLSNHRVVQAVLLDVGVDVVTLAVQLVQTAALGVLVHEGVGLLVVRLATLGADHRVLLALVRTVPARLAASGARFGATDLLDTLI